MIAASAPINETVQVQPLFEFNSFIFIILKMESVNKGRVKGCDSATVCTSTRGSNGNISDKGNNEVDRFMALFYRAPTMYSARAEQDQHTTYDQLFTHIR